VATGVAEFVAGRAIVLKLLRNDAGLLQRVVDAQTDEAQ